MSGEGGIEAVIFQKTSVLVPVGLANGNKLRGERLSLANNIWLLNCLISHLIRICNASFLKSYKISRNLSQIVKM